MQPSIKKTLAKIFHANMESNFPDFMPYKIPETPLNVWRRTTAQELYFFVALVKYKRNDVFVLEIAWSEDGEYPFDLFPAFDVERSTWRERLARLWKPTGSEVVWDLAPEVTAADAAYLESLGTDDTFIRPAPPEHEVIISRIAPLVDDALSKFKQYAFPVFNEVTKHRGYGTPFDEA